jgi:peptidoglycan/xylan/chitin deacetylase (PgdA/CDA1 family)
MIMRGLRGRRRRWRAALTGLAAVGGLAVAASLGSAATSDQTISAPATPVFAPSAPVSPGRNRIPILMYHVIEAPSATAAFPGLWVPPSEFAGQMQALKTAGFHAISQDQAGAYWQYGAQLPPHPIVVTFDNGYASQYTQAMPILRKLGWIAVENQQLSLHPPEGLTHDQVRGLLAAGWELDTQGFTHADLVTASDARLNYEVAQSRARMQRLYGAPVNWFCYPSGHYDPRVVAAVKAAGYKGSTTVIFGWASPADTYRMARLRVLGGTSPQALVAQVLANKYDPPPPIAYPPGG